MSWTLDILKIVVKLYLSYFDLSSLPNYYIIDSFLVRLDSFSYGIHAGQGFSYRPPNITSDFLLPKSLSSLAFLSLLFFVLIKHFSSYESPAIKFSSFSYTTLNPRREVFANFITLCLFLLTFVMLAFLESMFSLFTILVNSFYFNRTLAFCLCWLF